MKKAVCAAQKPKLKRWGWGKGKHVSSKMPALRENSGVPVTKTAFLFLISPKVFYRHARKGKIKNRRSWSDNSWKKGASQRLVDRYGCRTKEKRSWPDNSKKKALPRGWPKSGTAVDPIQIKNPSQVTRHAQAQSKQAQSKLKLVCLVNVW